MEQSHAVNEPAARSVQPRPRLEVIDVMKGMAIFLVVLGHIVARDLPAGNAWYWNLKYWIYHFHMPLFMYLSGMTFFLFQKPIPDGRSYVRFLGTRAERLLPALFIVGICVVVAKALASGWLHVDNPVRDVWGDVLKLFYDPLDGALSSVWFVYALFVIYVVVGPLLLAARWNPYAILIPGALAHFIPLTNLFCLSSVGEYLFMFGLGCVAARHYQQLTEKFHRHFMAFLLAFAVMSAMIFLDWNEAWKKVLLSLVAVPVAHGLASTVRGWLARAFAALGIATFIIYLLNTSFIGMAKALMLKVHPWDGYAFLVFAPVLLLAGTAGPMLLKSKLLKKSRILDRLTG